ncbi:MAG: thiamine phosphate synthase [Bacteroidetes bacterium]|uniref:Thiamine-phosphate synthase n=1 Tax=Candidatus Merdivivens pullicola TaxID=2840872 RepID=A0A9D9NH31_9BACT|nr:thiamine phosphate synthase [Candidatus Merdivivens pullicola]
MEKVQFISHHTEKYSYADSVRLALKGGCKWIQLRMKDASEDEILETASQVRKMCDRYEAVFILDDHVRLVEKTGADGVHLGKNDMPVDEARRLLGNGKIIGGTANTLDDIIMHCSRGADYIGCGPFRFTTTKKNLAPVLGLEGYKEIMEGLGKAGIKIPVAAIGGITVEDIPAIMATGINGIAISGSVLKADDPVEEMKKTINTTR